MGHRWLAVAALIVVVWCSTPVCGQQMFGVMDACFRLGAEIIVQGWACELGVTTTQIRYYAAPTVSCGSSDAAVRTPCQQSWVHVWTHAADDSSEPSVGYFCDVFILIYRDWGSDPHRSTMH